MSVPIDPTDTATLIQWAMTLFGNDYLDVQAISGYWSPSDEDRYGQTRQELDALMIIDAIEMYKRVVPEGYVVVRRDDLSEVIDAVTEDIGWELMQSQDGKDLVARLEASMTEGRR